MKTKRVEKITSLFIAIMMLLSTFISVNASTINSSQGNGKSKVVAEIAPAMFSATVPYVLPISVDADNNVSVADNARIVNNSNGPINVVGADISTNNGWEIVDSSIDFKSVPVNTKQLKLEVMNESLNPSGSVDTSLFDTINGESSISLTYNAETAVQSEAIDSENVANALFTVEWNELFISKATIDKSALNNFARNVITFQRTQENLNIDDVKSDSKYVKIDDNTTDYSIYAWKDSNNNGYWWTDAVTAYLPEDSTRLFERSRLTTLDLYNFNTSNVTNMSGMFYYCEALTSLDLSSFDTSKVTNMSDMFYWCDNLTSLDVSSFDTSKVTDMRDMFRKCSSLTSLDLSNFDTSNVTNMAGMFGGCFKLNSLDVSNFDTSNVTDMHSMFGDCYKLSLLDVSNFDTSKVTNMYCMFSCCSKLTSLDLSNFDTSVVENMAYMFQNCIFTSLNISNFDTSKVTDMRGVFFSCKNLTSLDLSNFDTSNVTNMQSMFEHCKKLTSLNISNFDTSKVTDMSDMFRYCQNFTSLDLSNFDTSKVTNMGEMFRYCSKLTSLDLSNFDTSAVKSMAWMFRDCFNLTSLDLSSFDTSNTTEIHWMFNSCHNLKTIYAPDFDTSKVSGNDSNYMFTGCTSLVGGNGTKYNSSYTDKTYARIDKAGTPGYFTYKAA